MKKLCDNEPYEQYLKEYVKCEKAEFKNIANNILQKNIANSDFQKEILFWDVRDKEKNKLCQSGDTFSFSVYNISKYYDSLKNFLKQNSNEINLIKIDNNVNEFNNGLKDFKYLIYKLDEEQLYRINLCYYNPYLYNYVLSEKIKSINIISIDFANTPKLKSAVSFLKLFTNNSKNMISKRRYDAKYNTSFEDFNGFILGALNVKKKKDAKIPNKNIDDIYY
jgi:hypothetical protein